jgi:hypothetical protein
VLVTLRLEGGETVRARWRPEAAAEAGERVRISVPGEVSVFGPAE